MRKKLSLILSVGLIITSLGGLTVGVSAATGDSGDPFVITSANDFKTLVVDGNMGKHFIQTADIDLSELGDAYVPKSTEFTGTYRGMDTDGVTPKTRKINMGTVSNSLANYGLFHTIGAAGIIENIGITGSITSDAASGYIGSIASINKGKINNCFSEADVSGTTYVGGIAGDNRQDITKCYTTGNVTGSGNHVGGIAGGTRAKATSTAQISECYATGNISGGTYVGGILGHSDSYGNISTFTYTISNCYFLGTIAGNRAGGILGSGPDTTKAGTMSVVLQDNYYGNPANTAYKIYGYYESTGTNKGTKTITAPSNRNFYFTCNGEDGCVVPADGRGTAVEFDKLTGPNFDTLLEPLQLSGKWAFMPEEGDPSYKFPQLINNPQITTDSTGSTVTPATISKHVGKLPAPTISDVEAYLGGTVIVKINEIVLDDTITSYTVEVKDGDGNALIGTKTDSSLEIDITDIINQTEASYQIRAKADNGYKNNGSDFGTVTNYTYETPSVEILDTPEVTVNYIPNPETYSIEWGAVTNATSYDIKVGLGEVKSQSGTALDITSDIMSTPGDYVVRVIAKGNDAESLPAEINVCSYFGGGNGVDVPYKVYNLRHLNNVGKPGKSDKKFVQMNDITDVAGFTTPINEFSGTYTGDGLTPKIINLKIERTNELSVGFIKALTGTGLIENIEMQGSVIANGDSATAGNGSVNFVGAFVGFIASSDAAIKNCINRADVTNNGVRKNAIEIVGLTNISTNGTGGIAGLTHNGTNPTISGCKNYGEIKNTNSVTSNVGGIVGYSNTQNITECENRGKIEGPATVGGITGANYGKISKSKNLYPIILPNTNQVGGITGSNVLGVNGVAISECFNSANVYGKDQVGGLCGMAQGGSGSLTIAITIENSFNSGEVYGASNVGSFIGLVGHGTRKNTITLNNCYSSSKITRNFYGGEAAGSEGFTATTAYYLYDGTTNNTGFLGTSMDESQLENLTTTKPGEFSSGTWATPTGEYPYPTLKNCAYEASIEAIDTKVTITAGENGEVSPSGDEWIISGSSVNITVTPDDGYYIASIELNGAPHTTNSNPHDAARQFSVGPIYLNSSIAVTFAEISVIDPVPAAFGNKFTQADGTLEVEVQDGKGGIVTKSFNGPVGIVFATVANTYGFTLMEYGMLFSKSAAATFELDGTTLKPLDSSVKKIKGYGQTLLGQYGVLFHGVGLLPGIEYQTAAYGVYKNNETQETKIVYTSLNPFTISE